MWGTGETKQGKGSKRQQGIQTKGDRRKTAGQKLGRQEWDPGFVGGLFRPRKVRLNPGTQALPGCGRPAGPGGTKGMEGREPRGAVGQGKGGPVWAAGQGPEAEGEPEGARNKNCGPRGLLGRRAWRGQHGSHERCALVSLSGRPRPGWPISWTPVDIGGHLETGVVQVQDRNQYS